jgi:hypothetical protein
MTADNHLGKALPWLHLFMDDLGLAFEGPEDNAATGIIAHTGKLTPNIRHIALKTISLQTLVHKRTAVFPAIGSANNGADHFTKALPLPVHHHHHCDLMGLCFSGNIMLMRLYLLCLQHSNTLFHQHYVLDFYTP